MLHVLNVLNIEISHSHNYGEKEVVLPLLHLFREFLTMVSKHTYHVRLECDHVRLDCDHVRLDCDHVICLWMQ